MEQDFDRFGIGGEDDEFTNPTVESLGGFVGALAELFVV